MGLITFDQMGDALTSEWLPAWVQALGSIGAILAAAAFVLWQHQLDRARDVEARVQDYRHKIAAMSALAKVARNWTENLKEQILTKGAFKSSGEFATAKEHLAIFRKQVAEADLSFLRKSEFVYAWMKLTGAMLAIDSDLAVLVRADSADPLNNDRKEKLTKSFAMVDTATLEIEALANAEGSPL